MTTDNSALFRTIWRWHFYAGLFSLPFILLLALSGAVYLFKPQIERWEERAFQSLPTDHAVTPSVQVMAALAAFPGARLHSYRLPERPGDAVAVQVALPGGTATRDVFVSPQGTVLGSLDPGRRVLEFDKRIHGQLLLGKRGSWLVELAASWAIVLVLSGLYLWWPRGRGVAGVLWPRLGAGGRAFWRDLHAVIGFWISALVLVLLVTGLPWAGVWGEAFKQMRAEFGWVRGEPDWTLGGEAPSVPGQHAGHTHRAGGQPAGEAALPTQVLLEGLDVMVATAAAERLAFPVIVTPPGAPGRFGRPGAMVWSVRSDAQNRPLRTTITYEATTGRELSRLGFVDDHVIDRVVGYGVAWHEGQLFGWINQLVGVLTALGLVAMAVSGFVMWRRRRPTGSLGAPPASAAAPRLGVVGAVLLVLAALLPLLAVSLLVLWLFERLALPRLPGVAAWLGVPVAKAS